MTTTASALTETLVKTWSSDMAIIKREKVDTEWLDFLRNNPDVPKHIKIVLNKWSAMIVEGCWVEIPYLLGKASKDSDEALGRLNAKNGVGLQAFPRDIRNALGHRIYWDIDIAQAHPTLCRELSRRNRLPTAFQDELIEYRDEKLAEIMDIRTCDKSSAKKVLTSIYFGDTLSVASLPDWYAGLYKEIDTTRKVITQDADWVDSLRFLNGKRKNRLGSAFSYILQTIERACLLAMEKSAKANGRSLDVYIHDGGLIRKREGETEFPSALLRIIETDIATETGFAVSLVSKPMDTSYVLAKKNDDAYLEMKTKFEEEVMSINNPPTFLRIKDNKISQLSGPDLEHIYGTMVLDDKKFLTKWIADKTKRSYESLVFQPGCEVPSDRFNLWRGFPIVAAPGDVSVIQDVLMTNCNDNREAFDYVENYVAHMFQKPSEKPGVCICFQSSEEGAGKETFWNFIGDMLGGNLFFNTSRPEDTVFGRFTGALKEVLLIKFEEADFSTNRKNEGGLKALITSTHSSYESKGENAITLQSFSRTVMTTNEDVPFVVSDTSRRFMMIRCSNKNVGNTEYWTQTHSVLARPESKSAYMDYLMKKDITAFNPRVYPKTDYLKETITATRPFMSVFFQREIERTFTKYILDDKAVENEEIEWSARELFNKINEGSKFPITETKLGRDVKNYPILKKKGCASNSYHIETFVMREFLQKKGWWSDFFSQGD